MTLFLFAARSFLALFTTLIMLSASWLVHRAADLQFLLPDATTTAVTFLLILLGQYVGDVYDLWLNVRVKSMEWKIRQSRSRLKKLNEMIDEK